MCDYRIIFSRSDFNSVYYPYLKENARYLHIYGGAGSGKSVFAAQKVLYRITAEKRHRILLIRKVARTIRASQFSLLKSYIESTGLKHIYRIKDSDLKIINTVNGSEIISAGVDDREKLKSIHGITSIWIEEATELDYKDFIQIDLRLRGRSLHYKQILLTYNPVNSLHWLNTKRRKNSTYIRTTYKDNKFIEDEYRNVLEDLKHQDGEYYRIYGLGEWGILRNLIYQPFEIIDDEITQSIRGKEENSEEKEYVFIKNPDSSFFGRIYESKKTGEKKRITEVLCYPPHYDEKIYGIDFGYNNPAAVVEIGIKDGVYFLKEILYRTKMTVQDMIEHFKENGIKKGALMYCDSSEPGMIEEIRRAGYNAKPADRSIKAGIDFVRSRKIYSNPGNININREVQSYVYQTDKDGNILDEPVKFNDHMMDAIRYAVYTHGRKQTGKISVF